MPDTIIDHDTFPHSPAKLQKAPKIKLEPIFGILPFDGVRNPSSRSAVSHKVILTYRTAANDWQPKIGMAESAAEAAVAHEALIDRELYDLHFQPLTVDFRDEDGRNRRYTHDLLLTFRNGHRRLVFVRNEMSLSKSRTTREIRAIVAATPKGAADDMIVVNANDYSRQRRENLFRMHLLAFRRDDEADEMVLDAARRLKTLWLMRDLFPHIPISEGRIFQSCYRLVARRQMLTNLDHVFWEHSRVEVAA